MSGMHWEKRNKERKVGIPVSERFMRTPGWKDRPSPVMFKRFFNGKPPVDNCSAASQKKRKARVTLPSLSILKR